MLRPWSFGICLLVGLGLGDEGGAPRSGKIIRGVVVDEAGKPVAGAEVRTPLLDRSPVPASTAADGSFQLAIVGERHGGEFLSASAEGGKLLGTATVLEPESTAPAEPARIVLKPSRTVAVRVRDDAGRPVAGAAVEISGVATYRAAATTDGDGRATLRAPADLAYGSIFALKGGVGLDYFPIGRRAGAKTPETLPDEVMLTLDGARTVRIKAVDSLGLPVAGVEFYLWTLMKPGKIAEVNLSGSPLGRALTNGRGVATFDWIPPRTARRTPFNLRTGLYFCPDNPSYPAGAPPAELTARLLRMTTLRGTVRQRDGQPAPNILLRVEGHGATNPYFRSQTRTAEDGSYSIDVYPDKSYMIAVLDDKHAARTLTGVVVREGQPWEALDLKLIEGTLLHGRVTRAPGGEPVAGISVTLMQKGQPLPADIDPRPGGGGEQSMPLRGRTDADGRYRIRVGPGRYELNSPNFKDKEALTIADEPEIVRDFHVTSARPDRVFNGRALEQAATGTRPIPGALIEASTPGGDGRQVEAVADGEGRFRITVDRERDFVVLARDREGKVAGLATVTTEAAYIEATARPAARIKGRVVDDRGQPRGGIAVRLRLTSGPDPARAGHFDRQASTDTQGRYDFRGVPVGSWALVSAVDGDDAGQDQRTAPGRREVRGPEPIEWPDLVLPAAGRPGADG